MLVAVAAGVVLVLVVAQLVLPGIAVERVRERVGRYGEVRSVHVHAVPGIALLWGSAQEVAVQAGTLRASPHALGDLEQQLSGIDRARLSSPRIDLLLSSSLVSGEAPLEGALLEKRGSALSAVGSFRASTLALVLPVGLRVDGLSAQSGHPEVSLSGEAFGVRVSGRAIVTAKEGAIVIEPAGLPFAGLASVTLFADSHVYVESVTATPTAEGIAIALRARPAG